MALCGKVELLTIVALQFVLYRPSSIHFGKKIRLLELLPEAVR